VVELSQCKECTKIELCCEFRKKRQNHHEDSESSARWALSGCIGAQEDRTTEHSGRRHSARWAFELVCRQAQRREENSLSSGT
jgi:hypothetical protein